MQFIVPDIIAEGRGLSVPVCVAGLAIGLLLWLTGWWAHRFWIVLVSTVVAGVVGLLKGPGFRIQPLLAALLLAVAAGLLALALIRVVAFAAGGMAAWMAVQALAPPSWHEPLICFLVGGLVGLLLFRISTMLLTSFMGALWMGYFGLWLADRMGKLDALAVVNENQVLLGWSCGAIALAGFVIQYLLERRRIARQRLRDALYFQHSATALKNFYDQRRWWLWGPRGYRRAG